MCTMPGMVLYALCVGDTTHPGKIHETINCTSRTAAQFAHARSTSDAPAAWIAIAVWIWTYYASSLGTPAWPHFI